MTKARTLADNFAADINGITAGTGITGGGTSGTVTVTNSMATTIDAKGDLVVGTGADTFGRLAVASTAGYLLAVDSGETTGLKWAAPAGGGKVLQVVSNDYSTTTVVASTTFTDTGLTATITPTSATSTILIFSTLATEIYRASTEIGFAQKIFRGATEIFSPDSTSRKSGGLIAVGGATSVSIRHRAPLIYRDSPATTSAITYKIQVAVSTSANSGEVTAQQESATSTMILMEIGA